MFRYFISKKYRFFHRKLYQVQASIWETEFKISKSRQVREGVRQDRDRAIEALHQIEARTKGEQDTHKKGELEKEVEAFIANVKRYEAQMKMIDDQIKGAAGDETHEPIVGLMEQLKSYIELKLMYQDFLRTV